jgi:RES domain-containing protein
MPNRRDGRWNTAGHGCTQYFCLDAEAPYAEKLRAENLRTEAAAATYRCILWQARVDEGAVVDYGTFEKAEASGFPAEALVEDDHERCQGEAQWLMSHNVRGLLSPCAALPGSVNLTLFGARVEADWATRTRLASMLPVQRLAEGSPPRSLSRRVCFFGQAHAGLVEYRSAQQRLFEA